MFKHSSLQVAIAYMAVSTAAFAADPTMAPPQIAVQHAHSGWNAQNMEQHLARQIDKLKTLLQLTPDQESAWAKWSTAIKPQAPTAPMPDHAEFEKMTTPERLDILHGMRAQRNADMDRHEQATKEFYAGLTQSQRKVFDMESLAMFHDHRRHRHAHWNHTNGTHAEAH